MAAAVMFEDPPVWSQAEFDRLLVWAAEQRISDIKLGPASPPWACRNGEWVRVSTRSIANGEIMALLDTMSRNRAASATVQGARDYDFAYEVRLDRERRQRFRVNATGCRDGWSAGMELTLRGIPGYPPTLDEIEFPLDLVDAATPANGLVLVTGVMGSGKSATLSALLRWVNEHQPRAILTYESPIEYVLCGLPAALGPVSQSEVPTHFASFADAPRNAARRAANIILVGESRDAETLHAMIEAADIGSVVYSTLHTRSVAESPARVINMFPERAQPGISAGLLSSLRLIMQQRLVPRLDPASRQVTGRIALREWLVFTPDLRDALLDVPRERLTQWLTTAVRDQGRPLLTDATEKHAAGLISDAVLHAIRVESDRTASRAGHGMA